jgi:hypothetical protein
MDEIHFEPAYGGAHYVAVLGSLVPGAAALVHSLARGADARGFTISVLLLVVLPLAAQARHVRRVVFGSNLIVVRYLLRDRFYNYHEILRVSRGAVHTVRGTIPIGSWKNRDAFVQTLVELRDRGVLSGATFDGDLASGVSAATET